MRSESLLPIPGLDEHVAVAGSDEERIRSGSDEVALIRTETLRPHDFRHDAKEGAAIDRISPVGENRKFEIAKEGLHSEISNYWEHGDCSFIYLEKIVIPSEARNLLFAGDATRRQERMEAPKPRNVLLKADSR